MNDLEQISKILTDTKKKAKNDGLYIGIMLAERILKTFSENHKLVTPHSTERLVEWANKDIEEIRTLLK